MYHLAEAAVRAHRAELDSLQERTEDHRLLRQHATLLVLYTCLKVHLGTQNNAIHSRGLLEESKKPTAEPYHGERFANMVWYRTKVE